MSLLLAALAALLILDAIALYKFLQSRGKLLKARESGGAKKAAHALATTSIVAIAPAAPASVFDAAVSPSVSVAERLPVQSQSATRPSAASFPLALKHDLQAIEEELLQLRARLNNHEITHLSAAESSIAVSGQLEISGVAKAIEIAKAENFSQLTQVAVELSAVQGRIAALERKTAVPAIAEKSENIAANKESAAN